MCMWNPSLRAWTTRKDLWLTSKCEMDQASVQTFHRYLIEFEKTCIEDNQFIRITNIG
jgi:hypothetical protein